MSILSVIILSFAALLYLTRSFKETLLLLDHKPESIGSVLALICDSQNLLELVSSTEGMTVKQKETTLVT